MQEAFFSLECTLYSTQKGSAP